MTTQICLSVALLVALSSNIVLLLILLVKSSNTDLYRAVSEPQNSPPLGDRRSDFMDDQATFSSYPNMFPESPRQIQRISLMRNGIQDDTSSNLLLLGLLQNQLLKSAEDRQQTYRKSSDNDEVAGNVGHSPFSWTHMARPYRTNDPIRRFDQRSRPIFRGRDVAEAAQRSSTSPKIRPSDDSVPESSVSDIQDHFPLKNRSQGEAPRHRLRVGRGRRQAVAPSSKAGTVGEEAQRTHEVFSSFTEGELARFEPAIYDLLIPALIHLETMIVREFDSLQSIIVAHDLRLENLEQALLNLRSSMPEPQSDSVDNKSEPDMSAQILARKEGLLPVENGSEARELSLDVDGSGDVIQWTLSPSTMSPRETPPQNVAFYDMYRILGSLEQKVMSLENYNVMSDSELTRVRSEVVKMDDKVTELDRQQRNLQIRTSMHTQKITELEVYVSKSELGIHTALDSYSRVNSRLETFKDKLSEFKSDLQAVSVQFGQNDQITSELRAADSYKAHDIQEVRKSVFSIEGRLSGLYRVLDQNLDTVRTDLRAMLDRLCKNNKLAC